MNEPSPAPKDCRGILASAGPEALRAAVMNAVPLGESARTEPLEEKNDFPKVVKVPHIPTSPPAEEGNEFFQSDKPSPHPHEKPPEPKLSFDPAKVFYATESGTYLVDAGTHYRTYARKSPVVGGIKRFLRLAGHQEDDLKSLIPDHLESIEIDRACDWTGGLAGYSRGIMNHQGKRFLITDEPALIEPHRGEWPIIRSILEQGFLEQDARNVFLGWVSSGLDAIRKHCHSPAPMIVLAGEAGCGKSLLAHLVKTAFGGRSASPMVSWSGRLPWNDSLLRSELLLIDDALGSTDPRARNALGASFKESIYAGDVCVNTRRKSSLELRPVWRVLVCCNQTPENLSVIPNLDDDIADKIALLKISRITLPLPAASPDEKLALRKALLAEMPAFIDFLEQFKVPTHLSDSRAGVLAWKHPDLLTALGEISPEKRLENLIAFAMDKGFFNLLAGESRWLSAAEIQSILEDRDAPTHQQAQALLKFHASCGRSLTSLAKSGSPFVAALRSYQNSNQYQLTRPA